MQTRRVLATLTAIILSILVATAPAAGVAGDVNWSHTRHSNDVTDIDADNTLTVSMTSSTIHADDTTSGTQQWTTSKSTLNAIGLTPNGVAAINNSYMFLYDRSDGSLHDQTLIRDVPDVETLATNNNQIAYTVDGSGDKIGVRSAESDNTISSEHDAKITNQQISTLAFGDRNIYVDDASNGDLTAYRYRNQQLDKDWTDTDTFSSIAAIATNGDIVVVAGTDDNSNPTVAAFDVASGTRLWTHNHHTTTPTSVGINTDHVASGAGDTVITAALADGTQAASHTEHSGSIETVAMTTAATVSGDATSSNTVVSVENPARLSNPSPSDGTHTAPTTIEVDVQDPGASDSHTVRFHNTSNGNEIGTETLTGDGSASTSWSHGDGPASWNATIEDTNGNVVDTTGTQSFNTPATVEIREELQPHDLITTEMNATIRFFADNDTVYEREFTGGTLDLSGLPDTEYIITVRPGNTTKYTTRSVYAESIYTDTTIYLLDKTETSTIESRFVLDDATGEYDPNSIVFIEKPINESGDLRWRTIHSDQFGAEGVTVTMQEDRRHRVRLRNDAGSEQVVGPYRSDVGETVTVRPGAPTIDLGEPQDGWYANATLDGQTLEYRFADPENLTSEVNVTIYERGNTSNLLQPNETYTDLGSFVKQTTLSQSNSEKEWVVEFEVTRDGETVEKKVYVRNGVDLVPGLNREWRLIVAVMMLLISAGAFSVLNAGVGAVVVSIEGAVLYWTGWLQGATSAAAIVIALFIAILVHTYRTSGP